MIETGQTYSHDFKFTQDEVNRFAEVTGDKNPVHTDAEFAAKTMFKKPIMHGMLGAALFSKVFGVLFPGEGTIYLGQNIQFLKPMYAGKTYQAVLTVKEINLEKNRAVIETKIIDPKTDKDFLVQMEMRDTNYSSGTKQNNIYIRISRV
jgi:acyl dehydratase